MKEPFHCALFTFFVIWIVVVAFMAHPLLAAALIAGIGIKWLADFIYRADHPRTSTMLKGNGK